jgi:hypothetical protein
MQVLGSIHIQVPELLPVLILLLLIQLELRPASGSKVQSMLHNQP